MLCSNVVDCIRSIESGSIKSKKCKRPKCLKSCDARKRVVVEENRKRYELLNNGYDIAVFQVDGEMISENDMVRCDNLIISNAGNIAILLELKGADLRHAFEQIENTRKKLSIVLGKYKLYARIITSNRTNVPNIKTCPQYVAVQRNLRKQNGNLRTATKGLTENIVDL